MRKENEVNLFRTIFTLGIILIVIIISFYLYEKYIYEDIIDVDDEDDKYDFLLGNKEMYITPEKVANYTIEILNNTKELNTTDYITIFRYLRNEFTLLDVEPRPPVEIISRGYCSVISLNLLYTSILEYLGYDVYLLIAGDKVTTIMFEGDLLYMFDWDYYSPLEIDNSRVFLQEQYMETTIISTHVTRTFNDNFYPWVRNKL